MYYKSTRDSSVRVESAVAISQGISADGGASGTPLEHDAQNSGKSTSHEGHR